MLFSNRSVAILDGAYMVMEARTEVFTCSALVERECVLELPVIEQTMPLVATDKRFHGDNGLGAIEDIAVLAHSVSVPLVGSTCYSSVLAERFTALALICSLYASFSCSSN